MNFITNLSPLSFSLSLSLHLDAICIPSRHISSRLQPRSGSRTKNMQSPQTARLMGSTIVRPGGDLPRSPDRPFIRCHLHCSAEFAQGALGAAPKVHLGDQ